VLGEPGQRCEVPRREPAPRPEVEEEDLLRRRERRRDILLLLEDPWAASPGREVRRPPGRLVIEEPLHAKGAAIEGQPSVPVARLKRKAKDGKLRGYRAAEPSETLWMPPASWRR